MLLPTLTIAQIEAIMDTGFPDWRKLTAIEHLDASGMTTRMKFRPSLVRAGGTISGPALMALVDTTAYFVTLAFAGPVVTAVTSDLAIHFLARPGPADVIATARLLRLGRRLAVIAVELRSDGGEDLVAHATVSYALPSPRPT